MNSSDAFITVKRKGMFRELKTIGVSSVENEIADFYQQGKLWIATHCGDHDMFAEADKEREDKQVVEYLLSNVENILLNGAQLILDQVFTSYFVLRTGAELTRNSAL